MKKIALLAARDPSGMADFASKLVESFEYRLLAVETVATSELLEDCEMVDFRHAEKALREGVVSLLVANFSNSANCSAKDVSAKVLSFSFGFGFDFI